MFRWAGACVLVLAFLVSGATGAQAQTTCPALLPLVNSWQNLSYPSGVSSIYDRIGADKTINYGWGPSNLSGEPSGYGYANFHFGIDTNAVYERFYAPFNGTAYQISPSGWSGALIVKLVLPSGRYFYFAHLSDQIASGPVKVGDILGVTGNTGYSTNPHLHVQFMEPDGTAIAPEHWACKSEGAGVTAGTTTTAPGPDVTDDGSAADNSAFAVPPWTLRKTAGQEYFYSGGRIYNRDVNQGTAFAIRPGAKDGAVAADRVSQTALGGGLVFRALDYDNYWMLSAESAGEFRLIRKQMGSGEIAWRGGTPVAGQRMRVSFSGDVITAYQGNTELVSIRDTRLMDQGGVGFAQYGGEIQWDNFAYTVNPDGSITSGASTTSPDQVSADSGSSSWNPMVWLWDRVKGVLVPSETEWEQIRADLNGLAEKEPIGTVRDVSGFAATVKAQMVAPGGGGGAPLVVHAPGTGIWEWVSFGRFWVAAIDGGEWLASIIEGVTLGTVNALQLMRLAADAFLLWSLVLMVSAKVRFAA